MLSGFIADFILKRGVCLTNVRKLITAVALIGSSGLLISATFVESKIASVVLISLSCGFISLNTSGLFCNPGDLSPTFCGVIGAIMNTIANAAGIIVPMIIAAFTEGNPTREQYRLAFLLIGGVSTFSALVFVVLASAEIQPWDPLADTDDPVVFANPNV